MKHKVDLIKLYLKSCASLIKKKRLIEREIKTITQKMKFRIELRRADETDELISERRLSMGPLNTDQNGQNQESNLTKVAGKHWRELIKVSRTERQRTKLVKMIPSNMLTSLVLISAYLVLVCAQLGQTQQPTTSKLQPHLNVDLPVGRARPHQNGAASKWLQSTGQMGHRKHHQLNKRSDELADELEAPEASAVATRPANSDELEMVPTNSAAATALPISSRPAQTKLHIVRLFAPDSIQNGSQDVTIDCMFKYDKKLDRRLAVKWFFNDELEPIYEWIPELNKRVFSDKYERFIDKNYQVTEDVDFMLQAYKWLTTTTTATTNTQINAIDQDWVRAPTGDHLVNLQLADESQQAADEQQVAATRKLLASKLNKLAKLGGDHSRQLISSLRVALAMQDDEVSKFRALRLIRPGVELDGRFTCSVSSLDGDDLKSTRLIVYEPPKSFTFNVSKGTGQTYNLSCRAGPAFPRPSIALYRYRAVEVPQQQQQLQADETTRHAQRPKLVSTSLKQELLPGTQVQITMNAKRQQRTQTNTRTAPEINAMANGLTRISHLDLDDELMGNSLQPIASDETSEQQNPAGAFEVSAWALVDETSLSSNLVTQFECVLVLEGANYEQRQSLALQKGWHVNSYALTAKSTLVGLMSVLASSLCLTVAFVSALLIFKLLRRHANKSTRIHHGQQVSARKRESDGRGQSNGACESNSSSSSPSTTPSEESTTATVAPASGSDNGLGQRTKHPLDFQHDNDQNQASLMRSQYSKLSQNFALGLQPAVRNQLMPSSRHVQQSTQNSNNNYQQQHLSDGIYRVPENRSSFGTRYVTTTAPIGGQQQIWPERGMSLATNQLATASGNGQTTQQNRPQQPATISVNGKQLYC